MASDRRQWVLIPAAGESQRFRAQGYSKPKPLIQINYRGDRMSMLEHVISRIPREFEIVIGVRERETEPLIETIENAEHRWVVRTIRSSRGQADTVHQMLSGIPEGEPVIVMDCDTLMEQEDIEGIAHLAQQYAAVVAVGYDSGDTQMSRVDAVPHPTLFVEKRLISMWGMVSVRAFNRAGALRQELGKMLAEYETAEREPFLSEVLNRIPGNKFAFVCAKWTDWGTPEKVVSSGATMEEADDEAIRGHG